MQFTTLSTITGSVTASGTLGGGYTNQHQAPYISLFPAVTPQTATTAITRVVTGTGAGTASMSGGPTFTVPVLDTQEFYQGILGQLSPQIQVFRIELERAFKLVHIRIAARHQLASFLRHSRLCSA